MERRVDLILDSGAFSAWKKKESLTVEQYISFIERNKPALHEYVNLDVIPGEWGRVGTPEDVERSAAKGYENLLKMRAAGLEAMPVYHMGERLYWLERMIGDGFTYIGISPANDRTTAQKVEWLDWVYGYLCGSSGFPEIKTHGFGVTALPLLFRYPWYSADSVTWLLVGGYGGILVPKALPEGGYDYTQSPLVVAVSEKSTFSKGIDESLKHFKSMGEQSKAYIRNYIEDEGFDLGRLEKEYLQRQKLNCRFFKHVASAYASQPFFQRQMGLFGKPQPSRKGSTTNLFGNLKMVFTLTTSPEHSDILEDEGVRDRLLTYYYFKTGDAFSLADYVRTGRIVSNKKRKQEQEPVDETR